jgi:hypothetical protein
MITDGHMPSLEEVRAAYQAFARSPEGQVLIRYWQTRFGYMTRSVFVPGDNSATFVNIGRQSAYQMIINDISAALGVRNQEQGASNE